MSAPRDDRRPDNRLDPKAGTPPQHPKPAPPKPKTEGKGGDHREGSFHLSGGQE